MIVRGVGISWHLTIWCNWDSEGYAVIANDYRYILALHQIVISVCVCGRLYLCPSLCNTAQNAGWPHENRRNRNDNPLCNTRQPYKVGETTGPACFMAFWVALLLRTSFFPTTLKGQSLLLLFSTLHTGGLCLAPFSLLSQLVAVEFYPISGALQLLK